MADNKRSFILYADLLHTVEKMPVDKAGELFKTILEYVNDKDPQPEDLLISLVFEPIKQQLKRDLNRWEGIKDKRSEAGKASAEARRIAKEKEQKETNPTSVESVQQTSTNSTVSVNDNVTVNDNVNVTVIKEEESTKENLPLSETEIDFVLTKKIMDWFGFSEVSNFDKFRQVADFQKCLMAQNRIVYFEDQFASYSEYKTLDPKFKHNFKNFLGDQKELFENGAWNSENWILRLKAEKEKSSGKKEKPGKAEAVTNAQTQIADYWEQQAKNN